MGAHMAAGPTALDEAAKLAGQPRRLVEYVGLSATTYELGSNGPLQVTYRMLTIDKSTARMVPHLLGVVEDGCDHRVCDLATLNLLAAEYAVEQGWANGHVQERAVQLGLIDVS